MKVTLMALPSAAESVASVQPLRPGTAVPRRAWILAVLAAFLIVAFVPFLTCSPLPLPDYQNHMARMYILAELRHSPILQRYYEVQWQILPNLAMDLIVPPLARLMPVNSAMTIFAALTLGLLVAGCFAVHRVLFGRLSYAPFAAFLVLYNRHFLFGILNYLFSLGLALLTFALWVAWRRKPLLVRCAVFLPLAFTVFISHLAGLGVLGVLVAGYEAHSFLQEKDYRALARSVIAAAIAFGVPYLLFKLFSPMHTRSSPYEPWQLRVRTVGLLEVFNNYILALDAATLLFVAGAVGLGLWLGKARLHSRMWLPLLSLLVIYWVIPSRLFGSYYADRRLIPAWFFILACSLEWKVRPQRLVAVIALIFLVRTAVIVKNWSAINTAYQADLQVIDRIPRGAKVATAVGLLNYPALNNPPVGHLPSMAVIRRQVLINCIYAGYGYENLRLKPQYQSLRYPHLYIANNCTATDAPRTVLQRATNALSGCAEDPKRPPTTAENPFQNIPLDRFDYLLLVNNRYFRYPVPETLRPVYMAGDTVLYEIVH